MPTRMNRRQLLAAVPITAIGAADLRREAGAAPGAALQAELAEDQRLRLVSWGLPAYIRPSNEGHALRMLTQNTFRPPFYEDEEGNMLPGVCADWSVSEDGLVYTLIMDPNAKFSDGSQVTAADLKFSWEYASYPETKSGTAPYLVGPIAGSAEVLSGDATEMSGLVTIDDATLQVTLSQQFTPFPRAFSAYFAGVVKRDNVLTGDDWDRNPICCGPYQLESWNEDAGELSWVVNEHWWGTPPTITNINYRYIQDPNTESIMYDNDEVDIIHPPDILTVQLNAGPHADDMYLIPYGGLYMFAINTAREPMEDVNVRRALQKATDMGTIVQAVFQGGAEAAFGITSPNLAGYTNPETYFDPEGAKAALAASTYGSAENLPPITIRVGASNAEYVRVTEAMQQMWQEVLGVEITISPVAAGEESDDGSSQIFRTSAGTTYPDPGIAVTNLGLSTNQYMVNTVHATNAELDADITEGNTLPIEQEAERIELYQQAEQMIMDQAYYIPITWVKYYYAIKPWVNGLKSNGSLSLYTLPEMTISEH